MMLMFTYTHRGPDWAVNRRDIFRIAGSTIASTLAGGDAAGDIHGRTKKVIVMGGGIAGLACGYELVKRGHEVIVLEANGRTGGHVRTVHDPLADGLYADVGAEHFYYPGYTAYWRYLHEFELTPIAYPRREHMLRFFDSKLYTEEDLHSRYVLNRLAFNQQEIDFLSVRSWSELPLLYLQRYVDQIEKETDPLGAGLNALDDVSVSSLLKREGASAAALRHFGGTGSALVWIWGAAVKKLRGTPLVATRLFRIQGGNQRMTDTFAARLGDRVHLGSPVTAIRHDPAGVTVTCREFGHEKKMEADHLVTCVSLVVLRQIPVTPDWPTEKSFVIQNMPYYTRARVVFQSRTRFWNKDRISPNWEPPSPHLNELWSIADEVNTQRGILIGGAEPGTTADAALAAFHKLYPGKSADIEQALVYDWATDPYAGMCERISYRPGELAKFWPEVTRPYGRIHFAGAYAAQMSWGQEAALESANRAAEEVDQA
jgi:monoamine oxidase